MSVRVDETTALAADNDVLKKVVCYRVVDLVWSDLERVGFLGAARYVVRAAVRRVGLSGSEDDALELLDAVVGHAARLEPTIPELELAAEVEAFGQRVGIALDPGESQLAAMTVIRGLALLQTGDKRAIAGFERALDSVVGIGALISRIQCFEQIILEAVEGGAHDAIAPLICDEPTVDKTMNICFACASGGTTADNAVAGLTSYINSLRKNAPRVLAA